MIDRKAAGVDRILGILRAIFLVVVIAVVSVPAALRAEDRFVAVISMDMMILPGTGQFLEDSIERAKAAGAAALVVELNTPGGMLNTIQQMTQAVFQSPIPVIIYVSPAGSTATSAGVFLTMSGHIAAMAPGTSIGAAHPVTGEGKDIEGDMRKKAENMTIAMARSIAEQRGRNVAWAEEAVKESSSVTEREALEKKIVDIIAANIPDILKQMKGRTVTVAGQPVVLEDLSAARLERYEISAHNAVLNVLSNPNILALLWLGATTGISLELYNPGAILPGVVGIICLILALAVSQVIPVSQGAIALLVIGAALIGLEFFVTSGILGIGGVISIIIGAMYLVDVSSAPGLTVNTGLFGTLGAFVGVILFGCVYAVQRVRRRPVTTGQEGMIGKRGEALEAFEREGKVFVNGEVWNAVNAGLPLEKGSVVTVTRYLEGMRLEVRTANE